MVGTTTDSKMITTDMLSAKYSYSGDTCTGRLKEILESELNIPLEVNTCCILGQVWYLIVSFPDLRRLSYFSFVQITKV